MTRRHRLHTHTHTHTHARTHTHTRTHTYITFNHTRINTFFYNFALAQLLILKIVYIIMFFIFYDSRQLVYHFITIFNHHDHIHRIFEFELPIKGATFLVQSSLRTGLKMEKNKSLPFCCLGEMKNKICHCCTINNLVVVIANTV